MAWRGKAGLARRGLARLGLGSAWQGVARQARQGRQGVARRGWARPGKARQAWRGKQGMERTEVAMNTERKDDGLDAAWCAFDAAVARLKRAVDELEHVLGRGQQAEHE